MRVRKQVLCPRNVAFPGDFLADARRGMGKTLALSRRRYWEEVVPTWGGSWLWDRVGPLPGSLWVHRDVGSRVGRECGSGCGDAGGLARQGDGAGLRGEAGADTRASPASAPPALHPAPVLTAPAPAGNWWHHHVPGRRGKFGTVYRLQEKATGKIRAGKYFRTRTAKEKQAARAEVELMNLLHHPRLVQCLAAFQGPAELVMVMEYVAGGELFERIVDDDFEHTEPSSTQYMRQILEGLQFMHGQAVVHLDLKPENIVCVSPSSHWLKIIDFGLARKLAPETPVKVLHGTPEFMAPEVVAFEPVGFSTDMWSIGVICYILLSGESPFQGDNDMETLSNITAARWDFEEETFSEISQQAKDFISQLLQKDPCRRLSSTGALLHPWLQQPQPSTTKALSKERIRQFLTRRKWQKTGKALLALNRFTLLSQSPERKASEAQDEEDLGCSPEENQASGSLLQRGPSFSELPASQEEEEGGSAGEAEGSGSVAMSPQPRAT
ncbi:myosin light chain kinase, smooth muscle-like isoform X1 [Larus michahellis]|uniref:myosin light chain kinase, smooth muscle-like isoform X1 n=1 Tax=Larus michahellis TaxID=119627 RepID=UPI003D9B149A